MVEVLDALPLIDGKMLELTRWMADYYACSWGQALDAAVPAGVKKHAGTRIGTFLMVPEEAREALSHRSIKPPLTPKQAAVLEILCRGDEPLTIADVCRLAKCTPGRSRRCAARGWCTRSGSGCRSGCRRRPRRDRRAPTRSRRRGTPDSNVDGERGRAGRADPDRRASGGARAARAGIEAGGFAPFLIHGVTGSGKTEVYLTAIEQVVARGREAIVLVPEISLTPQTIRRFRRRFGRVAVLHSHLSDAERHRHWQSIAVGRGPGVVGVRSAVFAPARRLGLIVIDEEHESTFKQETTPRYHARDVAVKRAQMEGIPVLLGSATPSLETWRNAERGRYTRLSMPKRVERPADARGRDRSTCGTRRPPWAA